MERVHRTEWVEWLDGLHIAGPVAVEPPALLSRPPGECLFRAAEYQPLHDTVELVLEDEQGWLRLMLESPTGIWIEREGTPDCRVVFETASDRITLRRCSQAHRVVA